MATDNLAAEIAAHRPCNAPTEWGRCLVHIRSDNHCRCGDAWPCLVRRLVERPSPPQFRPQCQSCKRCGAVDLMNFHVPDRLWQAIAGPEFANRVLCLACFDQLADQKGIDYADQIKDVLFCGQRWALWFADRVALAAAEAEAQRLADERERLRAALGLLYGRYEHGDPCYLEPDHCDGFLGNAVRLSDAEEDGIIAALAPAAEPDAGGERR
jgi:hypothetical protein